MTTSLPRIGILGGMGPLATADFFAKLTRATPAVRDQDHFPVTLESAPQIPDRVAAMQGRGEDVLPALRAVAQRLIDAGCDVIAMPCNTAHLWHAALAAELPVPFLHIADAVAAQLREVRSETGGAVRKVGLMGTTATLASRLYQDRIADLSGGGFEWVLPTGNEMTSNVMPGVAAVKRDEISAARALLLPVAQRLAEQGIDALVLGCTEIPLAITQADVAQASGGESSCLRVIDATDALACATVDAALKLRGSGARRAA